MHKCKNCGKDYDCKIEDCPLPYEYGFCSSSCAEQWKIDKEGNLEDKKL